MRRSLPDVKDPAPSAPTPALAPQQRPYSRGERVALLVIVALAAAVRIPALDRAPPGLNQDEAANAWNAWCLLKTGTDQTGAPWPVFYFRALGENRTPLYLYWSIPFQALGGLNIWTTRLPSAAAGVLAVLFTFVIARRVLGTPAAVVGGALLALNPSDAVISRIGHEAALGPLATAVSVAALLWAGLPLADDDDPPHPARALVAGALIGVACYGYPAIRLFLPLFLTAAVLANFRRWWRILRAPRGRRAAAGLGLGVAATFGPLAYYHLAHSEEIARRAARIWLWAPEDSTATRVGKVLDRYVRHFGPDFLFAEGDHFEMQSAAGFGSYQWYTLPLMIGGLGWAGGSARRSAAARLVLVWLLLYPAGDCLHNHFPYRAADGTTHLSLHALRSAPGSGGPLILAAAGAGALWTWARRRRPRAALGGAIVLAAVALPFDVVFLRYMYGAHNDRPEVVQRFQADLAAATRWLAPRLAGTDAVFVTTQQLNQPYVVMLVLLGYHPRQWFADEREVRTGGTWDIHLRVGKLHFLYDRAYITQRMNELQTNGQPDRVLFFTRPRELPAAGEPLTTFPAPRGDLLVHAWEL